MTAFETGFKFTRFMTSFMATAPNSVTGTSFNPPPNVPIAVLDPLTMTASFMLKPP
jgi:hypothetical protein